MEQISVGVNINDFLNHQFHALAEKIAADLKDSCAGHYCMAHGDCDLSEFSKFLKSIEDAAREKNICCLKLSDDFPGHSEICIESVQKISPLDANSASFATDYFLLVACVVVFEVVRGVKLHPVNRIQLLMDGYYWLGLSGLESRAMDRAVGSTAKIQNAREMSRLANEKKHAHLHPIKKKVYDYVEKGAPWKNREVAAQAVAAAMQHEIEEVMRAEHPARKFFDVKERVSKWLADYGPADRKRFFERRYKTSRS